MPLLYNITSVYSRAAHSFRLLLGRGGSGSTNNGNTTKTPENTCRCTPYSSQERKHSSSSALFVTFSLDEIALDEHDSDALTTDLRRALACIALRWELLLLVAFACAEPAASPVPRRRLQSRVADSSSSTTSSLLLPTMTKLSARFYNSCDLRLPKQIRSTPAFLLPEGTASSLDFRQRTRSSQARSSIHVRAAAVQFLQRLSRNQKATK